MREKKGENFKGRKYEKEEIKGQKQRQTNMHINKWRPLGLRIDRLLDKRLTEGVHCHKSSDKVRTLHRRTAVMGSRLSPSDKPHRGFTVITSDH
jgi:hypothetical protein